MAYLKGKLAAVTPKKGGVIESKLGPKRRLVLQHKIASTEGRQDGVVDTQWDTLQIEGGKENIFYHTANFDLEIK
jgi:hypothetical protein